MRRRVCAAHAMRAATCSNIAARRTTSRGGLRRGPLSTLLTQNGQPFWGRDRPSTFVWLSVQNGAGGRAVGRRHLRPQIRVDAAAPSAACRCLATAEAVADNAAANPADLAHRLARKGCSWGTPTARAAAGVHWTCRSRSQPGNPGTPGGRQCTADLYRLYSAKRSLAPVEIDVTGVGDLQDLRRRTGVLESLNFIAHVGVEALTATRCAFS